MKKAIIVGAPSDIGKELSLIFAENGYEVGLMARRTELLEALQKEIASKCYVEYIDLSLPETLIATPCPETKQRVVIRVRGCGAKTWLAH